MGRRNPAEPAAVVSKTFTLTAALAERLDAARAEGVSTSALVERLLRRHLRMPRRRPEVDRGHRWRPGESGNPANRRPREPQGEPPGPGTGQDTPGEDGPA